MKEIESYSAKKIGRVMLNANELYKDVTKRIKDEIMEEILSVDFNRYPDETNHELIQAYSEVIHLSPEHILAGNGSDEMLGLMIGYFLGKDKKLFTLAPDFSMYDYYASIHEANVLKYECEEDGSFDVLEFIEKGRQQHIHMVLFSNPNNPTGHYVSNHELKKIVEAFPSVPVIIDEAYSEFAKESMISCVDQYPNLYVTRTLSKAYGLAGARLGFLIGNVSNMKKLRPNCVPYNISSITQKVGVVVLRHAKTYTEIIEEIKEARDVFYAHTLTFKNMTFYPSQANYVYGRSVYKKELVTMFEEQGVIIRAYANDTFRVTIGSKEENAMILNLLSTFDKEVCEHANS